MRFVRRLFSFIGWFLILVLAAGILSVGVIVAREAFHAYRASAYFKDKSDFETMARQGEFVGGHLATVLSAATLALLIYTTYLQGRSARLSDARAMFASGIDAISRYDTYKPGCPQALRLLDHYSGLALRHDRREFYSLLNSVMTHEMRRALRHPASPYRNAVRVRRLNSLRTARSQLRERFGWLLGTARYYTGRFKKPKQRT